ncbi:hypothetical protein KI387_043109 [Taxus chinensis]|uniref:Uncharacterized protein n=1 Tax=Taxus chinensis TaxID=29808 RepID=A0AA38C2Q3_TAXCH|nr:hypothetical protein KI387_043109 [Taxus chinensis]
MRVPWALISTAIYKIFVWKKFDSNNFVLLSTDYNDTADAHQFCKNNRAEISEHPIIGDPSVIVFQDNRSRYICDSQKASQVRLLIAVELNRVPIVKEFKTVNGFMGVWTLCSADEAIRICFLSKSFRFSFRETVSLCLIEHMPLITDSFWITKELCGIPLYLNAKGNEKFSSILTLALIILDFTYNIWVPLVEKAYLMHIRCVQLLLSTLSPNLRFLFFYFLSNFDNKYFPCSISDLKVKMKKTHVFYTTDNTVLNCPGNCISKMSFDEVDIRGQRYEFQMSAFRVHLALQQGDNFVDFELRMLDVLFDLFKAKYTMSVHNFQTYIGCWNLLAEVNIGLVQILDGGLIKKMHLFGFDETIDLFWGSNVNVYKVDVDEPHYFLIAWIKLDKVYFIV